MSCTLIWRRPGYNRFLKNYLIKKENKVKTISILSLMFSFPFKSESTCGSSSLTLLNRPGGRQWSKPLIPEMCFDTQSSKANDSGKGQLSNPHVADDGTSRLVSCVQCCVRVHTSKFLFYMMNSYQSVFYIWEIVITMSYRKYVPLFWFFVICQKTSTQHPSLKAINRLWMKMQMHL